LKELVSLNFNGLQFTYDEEKYSQILPEQIEVINMSYVYIKPKKFCKYIDKTKVDLMLERARADNKRNYLIILTLWKTGLRNSELRNIKKKDIQHDQITVRQGKGHRDRIVPIDAPLYDLLNFYSSNMTQEDFVFPLSDMAIRNIVHKYQGDEDVHPHTLRHSFAVYCLKQGMNLRSLQKILGHSNLDTTAIYLDIVADDIKEDYKKIEW
jgi:integrase/recombinase XerD